MGRRGVGEGEWDGWRGGGNNSVKTKIREKHFIGLVAIGKNSSQLSVL
jgi:hypothetical protein